MNNDKIIELAKKLYALVKQGEGGEAENAKAMLEKLMAKHGITIEDVEEEHKARYKFPVRPEQSKMFFQIVASVIGEGYDLWHVKKNA